MPRHRALPDEDARGAWLAEQGFSPGTRSAEFGARCVRKKQTAFLIVRSIVRV